MIALPPINLDAETLKQLRTAQTAIDKAGAYPAKVAAAMQAWKSKNTAVFKVVRQSLTKMCGGIKRCVYCEDSLADEIEHVRPKDLYPEFVFAWENYLYSCGPCNGAKRNNFAVLVPPASELNVTRPRKAPVVPPISGQPLLIDPRTEDGTKFMRLDLSGSLRFRPLPTLGQIDLLHADYTIRLLKLNDNDTLVKSRQGAFTSYKDRLEKYADKRDAGASENELAKRRRSLLRQMGHRTVWVEMQLRHQRYPTVNSLFDRVPEALTWA